MYWCFILTCLKFSFEVNGKVAGWMASKGTSSAPALAGCRDELNEFISHQFLILIANCLVGKLSEYKINNL